MTVVREAPAGGRRSDDLPRRRFPDDAPLPMPTVWPGRLERLLGRAAERVVESGTRPEAAILSELSRATAHLAPGAAAALVDWEGAEVARQRAFGIVHGVVLHGLDDGERSRLLDRLTGAHERSVRR